jgi:hypothetical protein
MSYMKSNTDTPSFIRIGTELINLNFITSVERNESGRLWIHLDTLSSTGKPKAYEFEPDHAEKVAQFLKQYVIAEMEL